MHAGKELRLPESCPATIAAIVDRQEFERVGCLIGGDHRLEKFLRDRANRISGRFCLSNAL